jgi:hypothetical protein
MSTYALYIRTGTQIRIDFCWKNNLQYRKTDEGNTEIGCKVDVTEPEMYFVAV